MTDWDAYHYVKIDMAAGELRVEGLDDEQPATIKLALKEVRLAKKEVTAERRVLTQQISEIRAANRSKQAQRMPAVRGGGGFGKFLRGARAVSKAHDRSKTDAAVVPLEQQKFLMDKIVSGLDHLAIELERLTLNP